MTPRELFDRAAPAVNAGDVDGLLACYHPLVVQMDLHATHRGRDALRPGIAGWLNGGPRMRMRVLAYAEAEDTFMYEAEQESGQRSYGTVVLRDGLIYRETQGMFPVQATAAAAPGDTRGPVTVELEPYRAWQPRDVPDPRTAGKDALMPAVLEIVETEGPVLAGRAFGLYTRASGGKKLTTAAKAPLAGA